MNGTLEGLDARPVSDPGSLRNPFGSLDPNEIFNRIVQLGEEWAEAHATASFLEETRKPLLAQQAARRRQAGMPHNAAESEAYASDAYQKHVKEMVAARREANKKRVRYETAQLWAELLRTAAANRRAEMSLSGMQT